MFSVDKTVRKMFIVALILKTKERLRKVKFWGPSGRASFRRLKDEARQVFFGAPLFHKADHLARAIQKPRIRFVSVHNVRAEEASGKRLAENDGHVATRFQDRLNHACGGVFLAGESQVVVLGHFASEESRHAGKAGGVVVKLHGGKQAENGLPVKFDFLPWQITGEIQAESGLHAIFLRFLHGCGDFFDKLAHECRLVGEKQTSLCDASLLDGGIDAHACGVQACSGTASGCILARIKARKTGRSEVDAEG